MGLKGCSKMLYTLVFSLFLNNLSIHAQEFHIDNSNTVYKDKNGQVLSHEAAKQLMDKGKFFMEQTTLENGKIAITITPMTNNDVKRTEQNKSEWVSKWKNTKLPEFKLNDLQGNTISNSDLKNKIVVINFWFIGCKPCIREIPELNELVKKYKSESVHFIAPSFDKLGSLIDFSKKRAFDYTILAESKVLIEQMDINTYPTHLVVDGDGVIKDLIVGGGDIVKQLEALIQNTIDQEK